MIIDQERTQARSLRSFKAAAMEKYMKTTFKYDHYYN